jgi:hypothetical protein
MNSTPYQDEANAYRSMSHTMPTYRTETCRRCKGTGQHSNYGGDTRCFGCSGTGSAQVQSGTRPLTDAEAAKVAEYQVGLDARAAREAARHARRATRAA